MSNINSFEKLASAENSGEEEKILEGVLASLRKTNTPITITISENGVDIPVQSLSEKMDSSLRVEITFDNGESYIWSPLENNNIFLLLRE